MAIRAIIFDMDGVLFQTEAFYYQRRAQFLAQKGISIDHIPPSFFAGGRASQVWPEILGDDYENWDIPLLEQEYTTYKLSHLAPYKETVFPSASAVLSTLKERGIKMVIASNTDRSEIERALSEAQLSSYFSEIFSATECSACKPDPAVYEMAWQSLGISKSETLIVEDSEKGIAAGVAAEIEVWAIRDKELGVNQSKADRLIDSLEDLLEIFSR